MEDEVFPVYVCITWRSERHCGARARYAYIYVFCFPKKPRHSTIIKTCSCWQTLSRRRWDSHTAFGSDRPLKHSRHRHIMNKTKVESRRRPLTGPPYNGDFTMI